MTYAITTTFAVQKELFFAACVPTSCPRRRHQHFKQTEYQRKTIMTFRTIAASVLALGLLAPVAFAADGPAGSEVNNHRADYLVKDDAVSSTQGFSAQAAPVAKRGPVGDFIDETAQESNERSSNR
jgi:hypothetical protein